MITRVMTYNVHSFISPADKNSIGQVIELIRKSESAIIGLNEVEKSSPRTFFVNQTRKMAKALNMHSVFGPAIEIGPFGFFGNALLSKFPIIDWQNVKLYSKLEFRAAIFGKLCLPGTVLNVIITHLGLNKKERTVQIQTLAELIRSVSGPTILMGDFNAPPEELEPLKGLVRDIGIESSPTFPTENPRVRIDYIFVSPDIMVYDVEVIGIAASDHLPVLATLEI